MKNNIKNQKLNIVRPGCKDIWNAFMLKNAVYAKYDIPFCPTTSNDIPKEQVTWEEAKEIHRKNISKDKAYFYDAYINWYLDDYKFDNSRGIWHDYKNAIKIIKHFAGVITPDFSTNQDFPHPIKLKATYKMRAYGYWLGTQGIKVINNVRWGTSETFDYCFEGIPTNSIVSIGTVGGGPRKKTDRERFECGLYRMVEVLKPHTILIYGSDRGECFEKLRKKGIKIIPFRSRTAKFYEGRKSS